MRCQQPYIANHLRDTGFFFLRRHHEPGKAECNRYRKQNSNKTRAKKFLHSRLESFTGWECGQNLICVTARYKRNSYVDLEGTTGWPSEGRRLEAISLC